MCIPHSNTSNIQVTRREKKVRRHIKQVSQEHFEHGDPDFIDERTNITVVSESISFLNKIKNKIKGLIDEW